MEAAADALVGEDGHLSDDSKAGQSMKRHRSRVPMAASNDDAGGSSLAHATTFATEPSSSSTRTGGGDAALMPDQSGAEALARVEAPSEGVGPATELGVSEQEILSNLFQRASAQPLARSRAVGLASG